LSGTKEGAAKSVAKILAKNPNHFKEAGSIGGKNGTGHTFAHGKVDPAIAGSIGGKISRRVKKEL